MMIFEHAILEVNPSQTHEFELAFAEAVTFLRRSPGCLHAQLEKCLEFTSRYQLVVQWRDREAHTVEFRESDLYAQFRDLLMKYYIEKPAVTHYSLVTTS